MIYLNDNLLFAEGGRRYCFVHPDDPSKCIKTLSPNGDPRKRKKEAVWYKKFRPLSMFDDNLRELKSFQDLARHGDAVWNHFPRCYGIQQTDRGPGIVTDLIRDADGNISKTVRQYVNEYGISDDLKRGLNDFFGQVRASKIITRDFLDHNLVVRLGGEKLVIYMIDGFGSTEVLPVSSWFNGIARIKINRKHNRFNVRYNIQ